MQDAGYKRCRKCGETKPRTEYSAHKGCADGLRPECRACISDYNAAYRTTNAAKVEAGKKAYYDRTADERNTAKRKPCALCGGPKPSGERRRYCDNCEPIAAEIAADRNRLRASSWYAVRGARNTQYRTSRRALPGFVEDVHPLVVLERDDGACGICGEDVDPFDFHVDHIVPLSKGGEHSYANTQAAHPVCNMRKGAQAP